jgi:hypothetical protein
VGPGPHVQHDDPVVPVRGVEVAVLDDDVVEGAVLVLQPPAPHLRDVPRVRDVQDVDLPGPVVRCEDHLVLRVDPDVVDPATHRLRVLGEDGGVGGVGQIEHDDPVPAGGGALPGGDPQAIVRVDLDVVDPPGVELEGVGEDGGGGVRHVPDLHPVVEEGPDVDVVPSVHPLEDPHVPRVVGGDGPPPLQDELGVVAALGDLHQGGLDGALPDPRHHLVAAGALGHEHAPPPSASIWAPRPSTDHPGA